MIKVSLSALSDKKNLESIWKQNLRVYFFVNLKMTIWTSNF